MATSLVHVIQKGGQRGVLFTLVAFGLIFNLLICSCEFSKSLVIPSPSPLVLRALVNMRSGEYRMFHKIPCRTTALDGGCT